MLIKKPIKPLLWNNGHWGPKGSHIYYVQDGDDFVDLAKRDGWPFVWEFIHFNFKTYDAEEVNWYLKHFVGCTKSDDGRNYKFSSTDKVALSNGKTVRGHIFTKNRLSRLPENPHITTRKTIVSVIRRYQARLRGLRFMMYDFMFDGSDLSIIGDYVEAGRIQVFHKPGQSAEGKYFPTFNSFHLKHKHATGINKRALIIHECAHAIMDLRHADLTVHQSEAMAYVVQCLVADLDGKQLYHSDSTHNSTTVHCSGHEECKFVIGAQIAEKVRRRRTFISEADENRMLKTLTGDPHYGHKRGRPKYEGIPKRPVPKFDVVPTGA